MKKPYALVLINLLMALILLIAIWHAILGHPEDRLWSRIASLILIGWVVTAVVLIFRDRKLAGIWLITGSIIFAGLTLLLGHIFLISRAAYAVPAALLCAGVIILKSRQLRAE
jgi:uncharacterized membrane protein YGL010W